MVSIFCQALFRLPVVFSRLCISLVFSLHFRLANPSFRIPVPAILYAYPMIIFIYQHKLCIIFVYTAKTICFSRFRHKQTVDHYKRTFPYLSHAARTRFFSARSFIFRSLLISIHFRRFPARFYANSRNERYLHETCKFYLTDVIPTGIIWPIARRVNSGSTD